MGYQGHWIVGCLQENRIKPLTCIRILLYCTWMNSITLSKNNSALGKTGDSKETHQVQQDTIPVLTHAVCILNPLSCHQHNASKNGVHKNRRSVPLVRQRCDYRQDQLNTQGYPNIYCLLVGYGVIANVRRILANASIIVVIAPVYTLVLVVTTKTQGM